MKVLAYADLQATEGHERLRTDPSIKLQQWRVEKFFRQLKKIYEEHDCRAVWDLGDTTDDRSAIPVTTINAVCNGLEWLPQHNLNIKLIGNHEQHIKSATIHTGALYSSKFMVVQDIAEVTYDNIRVIAVSYPDNHDNLAKKLQLLLTPKQAQHTVVIGHFQLTGCVMNSGISLEGVPNELLKHVKLALLGHVHKGQAVLPHVHYIGSPFQQNFGESNEDKRVAIVDTATLEYQWVPITNFPEYRIIPFNEFAENDHGEDRIKVVLETPEEAELFYSHPNAANVVEPIYQYDIAEPTESQDITTSSSSPHDTLTRYVKLTPPALNSISDEDMVQFGLEIAGIQGD
jgi:DNA repair exonuclease SbcCD nuclease subunit